MRNLILALLILTIGSAVAKDDKDKIITDLHYLCLNTIVAGLNWTGGKWIEATFHPLGQFQLGIFIAETTFSDGSKRQFIHFTRDGDSEHSHCGAELLSFSVDGWVCERAGETIIYSEEQSRGGISRILGSTSTEDSKDSLVVIPFTCQKK
jgi:hypothetical protein